LVGRWLGPGRQTAAKTSKQYERLVAGRSLSRPPISAPTLPRNVRNLDDISRLPLVRQLYLNRDIQYQLFEKNMGRAPAGLIDPVRHHSIPLQALADLPALMRKAAEGGFNIHSSRNGVWLEGAEHGSHIDYNAAVIEQLAQISLRSSPNAIAKEVQFVSDTFAEAARNGTFLPGMRRIK
jgi:hypothetical protein